MVNRTQMSFDATKQGDTKSIADFWKHTLSKTKFVQVEIILSVTAVRSNTPFSVSKLKSVLRNSSDLLIGRT